MVLRKRGIDLLSEKGNEAKGKFAADGSDMSGNAEWQYCQCSSEQADEMKQCGCGKEHSDAARPIHWRELHWRWECAFQILLEENDEMRRRIVKMAVDKVFQRRRNLLEDFSRMDDGAPIDDSSNVK